MLYRISFLIYLILATPSCSATQELNLQSQKQTEHSKKLLSIFEKTWLRAKEKLAVKSSDEVFSQKNYQHLKSKVDTLENLEELKSLINAFLGSLNVSHTQFITTEDQDYYFFQSLFKANEVSKPKHYHIGIQYQKSLEGYRIRSVLDSYPAELAGLKKGDLIIKNNNEVFSPMSFKSTKPHTLFVKRGQDNFSVSVSPVFENIHYSMLNASKASKKIIKQNGHRIGYFHLWSGTNALFEKELKQSMLEDFKDCDSIILDIRDGYGGAWYSYLDPFYKDRESFYAFTIVQKNGDRSTNTAPQQTNHNYTNKPLVLITNSGSRSGKEAIAYQLKKDKRAVIVGEPTGGYFTIGEINFLEETDFLLYLGIAHLELDGKRIENKGVLPDVYVDYSTAPYPKRDPQLLKALEIAEKIAQ